MTNPNVTINVMMVNMPIDVINIIININKQKNKKNRTPQ